MYLCKKRLHSLCTASAGLENLLLSAAQSGEKRLPSSIDFMKNLSSPVKRLWRLQQRSECSNKFLFQTAAIPIRWKVVKVCPIQNRPRVPSVWHIWANHGCGRGWCLSFAKLSWPEINRNCLFYGEAAFSCWPFSQRQNFNNTNCTPPHIIWAVEIFVCWVALATGAWEFLTLKLKHVCRWLLRSVQIFQVPVHLTVAIKRHTENSKN